MTSHVIIGANLYCCYQTWIFYWCVDVTTEIYFNYKYTAVLYVDFMLYCLGCGFNLHDTIVLLLNIIWTNIDLVLIVGLSEIPENAFECRCKIVNILFCPQYINLLMEIHYFWHDYASAGTDIKSHLFSIPFNSYCMDLILRGRHMIWTCTSSYKAVS